MLARYPGRGLESDHTVSASRSNIFIFAEDEPEAESPTETIFEMYPCIPCLHQCGESQVVRELDT